MIKRIKNIKEIEKQKKEKKYQSILENLIVLLISKSILTKKEYEELINGR